jgi:nitronate monooxygenase
MSFPYTIIQAPMAGGFTPPALVQAVSDAGALGSFGFAYTTPQEIVVQSKLIKGQFNINLFIHKDVDVDKAKVAATKAALAPHYAKFNATLPEELPPKISLSHQFEAVLEVKPTVFSSTFGAPSKEMIKACQKRNIMVSGTATTLDEALYLQDIGVDSIVLQGLEAGGHRGTFLTPLGVHDIGLFALLSLCHGKIKTPLIAAGGIMNGQGIKAALTLGASAAMLGTAFLTTYEAGTPAAHKEMLLTSQRETILTPAYTGRHARGIRNKMGDELQALINQAPCFDAMNALTRPLRGESAKQGNPEFMSLWAGQAYRACRVMGVGELIATLKEEMK